MQRFKFKYLYNKKLYDVVSIDFMEKTIVLLTDRDPDTVLYLYHEFDDKNLIQCTGLKDKNGNLIFEGDILSFLDYGINLVACKHNGYDYDYGRIEFIENPNDKIKKRHVPSIAHELEVIGNVHEKAYLLEMENV